MKISRIIKAMENKIDIKISNEMAVQAPEPTLVDKLVSRWGMLILIGIFSNIIGLTSYIAANQFASKSTLTPGMILRYEVQTDNNGNLYCPVIDYQVQGVHQSYQEKVCSRKLTYQVGEVVQVYVDNSNPEEARIKPALNVFFWPAMFFFFGVLLMGAGIYDYRIFYRLNFVGILVQAKVVNISCFNKQGKRRTKLCFIDAVWKDPKTEISFEFKSQGLPFDPTPLYQGKVIEVLFDPKNPKHYKFKFDLQEKKVA